MATLAATLFTLTSLSDAAKAEVTITFAEIGGNVVATTAGSLVVPSTTSSVGDNVQNSGNTTTLYRYGGKYRSFIGGVAIASGLSANPSTTSGDSFGYSGQFTYLILSASGGSIYTPVTTFTWNGSTLASIGLGSLTTTPTLVHTAANGETISFANAVPEPATAILTALTALSSLCLLRRKRS